MANTPAKGAKDTQETTSPTDELSQLREIIFGQTNREIRADLANLEAKVSDNFSKLNNQLDKQFNDMKKLIESIKKPQKT